MFSKSQLQNVEDVKLSLYMDWLLKAINRCEAEADSCFPEGSNEVFHCMKQRMMHEELKRHSRELQRVLEEKMRRLFWWCH